MSVSDAVIILIIGSGTALMGLCCKLSYSSKCKVINLGCLHIERDTEHEQAITIDHHSGHENNIV
jgi:hypothetical protein